MASLGTRIGECRKSIKMTQEQLAEYMDVSSQAVSKWENDISCPDITLLPKLADYFRVSVDELLRGDTNTQLIYRPSEVVDINKKILRLTAHTRQGDDVKMNVPLAILKLGISLIPMINVNGNQTVSDTIQNIDFNSIIGMAECGVLGKLLEVKSNNGDIVEIFIE